jgi:hypothetical protein
MAAGCLCCWLRPCWCSQASAAGCDNADYYHNTATCWAILVQYSYQPASEQLENWLLDISQIGAVLPANAKAKASASLILAGWLVAGC